MKILITGINGLLGSELARSFDPSHEIIGISQKSSFPGHTVFHTDLSDHEATYATVTKINPDLIIHTAAMSNVDECELNPDAAYRINALGTRNLALACQRFDATLLYISTDYAFSGKDHPVDGYKEFDPLDPLSTYARSKVRGEWYVQHLLNKFLIARVSWLFGASRVNFVSQMASSLYDNKEIKAAHDMVSAPTYVKDLARAIVQLSENNLCGIYHLTNTGFASRYDIGLFIAQALQAPDRLVKKVSLKTLDLPAQRPQFSGLNNYQWKLDGFDALRPWQDAMKEYLTDQSFIGK